MNSAKCERQMPEDILYFALHLNVISALSEMRNLNISSAFPTATNEKHVRHCVSSFLVQSPYALIYVQDEIAENFN